MTFVVTGDRRYCLRLVDPVTAVVPCCRYKKKNTPKAPKKKNKKTGVHERRENEEARTKNKPQACKHWTNQENTSSILRDIYFHFVLEYPSLGKK